MNKENFDKVLRAIIVVSSMAEAICGKRFVKRISKRFRVLNQDAVIEVWVGVFNFICRDRTVHTGNVAFERSPIVKAEINLILKKIEEKVEELNISADADIEQRIRSIIRRKENHINNETKN